MKRSMDEPQESLYEDETDDMIFMDPENYRGDKDQGFSHQRDVARAIARVLETGSVEMKPGYTDFKRDKNTGEMLMSKYHPDTREMFIESVNNYYDICVAEVEKNKTYKKKIESILKKKTTCYESWAVKENKFWKNLDFKIQKEFLHVTGSIAKDSHFYTQFMIEIIDISRELARQLHLLLDEGKYWKRVGGTDEEPERIDLR